MKNVGAGIDPKRMNREQRVAITKKWAASVVTAKKIQAYRKYFGVDKWCAAKELKMAGVSLIEKHAERWATHHERKVVARKARQKMRKAPQTELAPPLEQNEHFYYIAGYTAAGFACGITWEEAEEAGYLEGVDE
jgi:hypothetical protein